MSTFQEKVRYILDDVLQRLDPNDLAQRMAEIRLGKAPYGVVAHSIDGAVEFSYGGRLLAVVEQELLADDSVSVTDIPLGEFVPELPDSIPDELRDP